MENENFAPYDWSRPFYTKQVAYLLRNNDYKDLYWSKKMFDKPFVVRLQQLSRKYVCGDIDLYITKRSNKHFNLSLWKPL